MDYCVATDKIDAERLLKGGLLSHAEVADTLLFLRKGGYSPARLQSITGNKDYTVRHYLRISKKLSPLIKKFLHQEKISFSLARAIASLPENRQEEEARKAIMRGISVHRFRASIGEDGAFCNEDTERYFQHLTNVIAEQIGFMVSISPDKNNSKAGTISIRYADLGDFDSICDRLRVNLSEL